jgi:hypothetical protein
MRRFTALRAALVVAASTRAAFAFCPATTCNLADPSAGCRRNDAGCETTGKPLRWTSGCVSFAVQEIGSAKLGIDAGALEREVGAAFARWTEASCDDGDPPRMEFVSLGAVACNRSEYNSERSNANIVLFEDDAWPYEGGVDTLATTVLRFNPDTGALYDADIQVNSAEFEFSVGSEVTAVDLASVLTHEVGHFFGLQHTRVAGATMEAGYDALDDVRRSLEADDVAGICASYSAASEPSSPSCTPRHGFSAQCGADQPAPREAEGSGCALSAPARRPVHPAYVVGFAIAFRYVLGRRRRCSYARYRN